MVSAGMEGDQQYPHWRQVRNYVCALAAVAVVLLLRVSISAVCGTRVMLNLFSLAVLVSAYLGGAGPGLLATGLVTLCVIFLLPSGFNFGSLATADAIMMVLFVVTNLAIIVLVEGLHRARRRAEQTLAEREQAEHQLRVSEERYRSLFMNTQVGLYRTTPDGQILEANPAIVQMLGCTFADELATRNLDQHGFAPGYPRSRFKELIARDGVVRGLESAWTKRDGSVIYVRESARAVRGPDGQVLYYEGTAEDITERKQAELALRESEEHYRLLAEHTEDFVSVHDAEEHRLYISPSYYRATGWTPADLEQSPWDARLHPDDLPAIKQARAANRAGQTTLLEHRIRCQNGNWLWIEARSKPILGADGQMKQLVVWSHDITERRQAEAALRERERLLREVIDLVPHHIFAKDRAGRYLFVNRAASICYGLEPRDLVGHLEMEFSSNKEFTAAFLKDDQEVIATGQAKFIPEEPITYADGSVHWLQTTKMAFTPPGTTERAVLGVAVDITERKQAELALRESEEKFRRIAANIDDVLYSVDAQTREFLYVSPAFELLLGYTRDDVRRMGGRCTFLAQVIQEGKFLEQERFMDALQASPSANQTDRWETWWRCKDGTLLCMEDHWIALYDGERLVATEGVLRNVTARKRLEAQVQQAQKLEAVGQLAGGVAHDFNNILQSILGFTELLLADSPPAERHHGDLLEIQKAAERAAGLTRQLLAFSRRQMITPTVLDLNEVVSNMYKMLLRLLGADIQLVTELATELPRVKADAGQIEQVIMNLAVNARDAMPHGGRITITTASVTLEAEDLHLIADSRLGRFVRLTVADTGTGIAPDILPHIFEPFFSTKGPGKGSGLGLSVIYGIAQQHSGWVNVYSKVGHGSVFKLHLPAYTGAVEAVAAEQCPPPAPPRGHSERILLIEDEPEIRRIAERVLSAAGYTVFAAATAGAGCARFAQEHGRFDLVFSDVVLPDQNGITTVEQFLQQQPQLVVLLCSGYTDERSRWSAIAEKKFRFLQKPYPAAELLKTVHALLAARPTPPA